MNSKTTTNFLKTQIQESRKKNILSLAMKGKDEVWISTQPSPYVLGQKRQVGIWKWGQRGND